MTTAPTCPEGLTDAVSLLTKAGHALKDLDDAVEPHLRPALVLLRTEVVVAAKRARNLVHVAGQA